LTGTTEVLSLDVVHDELTRRCNAIITGLMLYEKPDPSDLLKLADKSTQKDKLTLKMMETLVSFFIIFFSHQLVFFTILK